MRRIASVALAAVVVGLAVAAQAADDPTGTWKWSVTFNDQTREATLKLKLDGETLTGTMPGRNNQERAIEDASYKDGEISFGVSRERNGEKTTTKYKGKVSGDTITGTIETERGGQTRSREWTAKRASE